MIITGCQRSGTMSLANVFQINHEVFFTPETNTELVLSRRHSIPSESSWLAVPFLKLLVEDGHPIAKPNHSILHLVRHPYNVINSLEGINFWEGPGHERYREFIYDHLPTVRDYNGLNKSLYYWLEWNKLVESIIPKPPRIRIEDWTNIPRLNSRKRAGLTKEVIENTACKELITRVKEKAKEYNYE